MTKIILEKFSNFDWAIIRLASLQSERNQPGRLLFATVSLLTPQRPTPAAISKDRLDCYSLRHKGGTIFFRDVLLSASEAIAWYRSLNDESSKTPVPSLEEHQNSKYDGIELKNPGLMDDPLWPNLGLPLAGEWLSRNIFDETNACPFLGTVPSRVHRRFGNDTGFEKFLADEQAVSFIERRLHINLKDYPEYLGSLALIVPDPIIHKINNFMIPAQEDRGERIFYHITPQPRQSMTGLKISFFDIEAGLLSNFDTIDVPEDGIIDIEKVSCTGQYGYVITHPLHGIMVYSAPAGFLREINIQSHIVTKHLEVVTPESESPNAADVRYSVTRSQAMPRQSIGR